MRSSWSTRPHDWLDSVGIASFSCDGDHNGAELIIDLAEDRYVVSSEKITLVKRTRGLMDVCEDPRHQWLCWYPCPGCSEECGRKYRRKATLEEETAIRSGKKHNGIALANPRRKEL